LSRVELESFLKSFLLFFISLGLLFGLLSYINLSKNIQTLDEKLLSQMRVCSFDLKCTNFEIDFIKQTDEELYTLYKNEDGLSSYYPIPNSTIYVMSLHLNKQNYNKEVSQLKTDNLINFLIVLTAILFLSILFSLYSLYPLRNALLLTQEFIKDILHDFNTPLSSLRLNSSMLKRELGDNDKIIRIEQSVENILALQSNLQSYLHNHKLQAKKFSIETILEEQISLLNKNYPDINFNIDNLHVDIQTNQEAFTRIIINILSNAAKYNRINGYVNVSFSKESKILEIIDTGKGIKNPEKIFDRFYKEQERGIGIGLHIVKKLCEELDIGIKITSVIDKGTICKLNLSKLTLK